MHETEKEMKFKKKNTMQEAWVMLKSPCCEKATKVVEYMDVDGNNRHYFCTKCGKRYQAVPVQERKKRSTNEYAE